MPRPVLGFPRSDLLGTPQDRLQRGPAHMIRPRARGLIDEGLAIRVSLRELAADRALGLIDRAQLHAGTERGNERLAAIGNELAEAGRESVLAPLVLAQNVRAAWDGLQVSQRRAVIRVLMTVTLHSPGRGRRIETDAGRERVIRVEWKKEQG